MTSKFHPMYDVDADRTTGEWLPDTLTYVGAAGLALPPPEDTDDYHYDTFEAPDRWADDGSLITAAVRVRWVD